MVLELRRLRMGRSAPTSTAKANVAGDRHRGHRQPKLARVFPLAASMGMILSLMALGCGAGDRHTPAEPTPTPLAVREALRGAVTELLQLESAAFTLEHLKGTTVLIAGLLEMRKASGVVVVPDKFRLTVEGETTFPRSFVEIGVVTIGDTAYMTDIITGRWLEVPLESLPLNPVNLGWTLAGIIEAVESPVVVGTARLNGIDTRLVRGRIQSEDLAGLVPGAGEGFSVELDLWLEKSRHLLIQVLISGMVVSTDQPDTVRRLILDDINIPVDISPPE